MEKQGGFFNESERMDLVKDSLITERKVEEYFNDLDLSYEDLKGIKRVVDLGAGLEQDFARGVHNSGFEGVVISIDPSLLLSDKDDLERLFPEERERRLKSREEPEYPTIGAYGQDMWSIDDSSVDLVVALHSVTQYLDKEEELEKTIDEILRILNKDGEARLFPVYKTKNLDFIKKALEERGINHSFTLKDDSGKEEKYLLILSKKT